MSVDDAEAHDHVGPTEADDSSDTPSARAKPLPRRLPLAPVPPPAELSPPTLAPARMINEVLYCERLMYLEFVQGEWADNAYTADGQAVHRKVNEEGKPLRPAPDGEGGAESEDERPYVARSVWLSSERLGITAKLDLVEVDGGKVVPVEYKRGTRPDVPRARTYLSWRRCARKYCWCESTGTCAITVRFTTRRTVSASRLRSPNG